MKSILFVILMFVGVAQAQVSIEGALGEKYSPDMGSGVWYENGPQYPHTLDEHGLMGEVGLTGPILTRSKWGLDWHVDFVDLGRDSSVAQVDSDDNNYDMKTSTCYKPCAPNVEMVGGGNVFGIAMTVEPYYNYGGWKFGVLGGPFIYRASWNLTAVGQTFPGGSVEVVHDPKVIPGYVVGVSLQRKSWAVDAELFGDRTRGDKTPGIWTKTFVVELRHVF